ncbi:putative DNA-directed RNA polymerase II, partial [Gregarina niphandrodes]
IAEVPTMAIDLVSIEENSGVLQDEMLAHRLGLLPIDSTNIRKYVNKSECKCSDACAKCSAKYSLNIQCPQDRNFTVTHFDVLSHNQSPPLVPKPEDGGAGLIIAKLTQNQSIKAELLAFKGIGKIHTKWSPCATATFRYLPHITINQEMQRQVPTSVKKALVENCKKGLFRLVPVARSSADDVKDGDFYVFGNETEAEYNLVVGDPSVFVFNKDHEEVLSAHGYKDFVKIDHILDTFLFDVEGSGAMPALQILKMGLEVLIQKLDDILENYSSLPQVSQAVSGFGRGVGAGASAAALDLS